jgi:hypothetical protein
MKRALSAVAKSAFSTQASVGTKVPAVTFKLRVRTAELTAAGAENPFDWVRFALWHTDLTPIAFFAVVSARQGVARRRRGAEVRAL